MEHFFELPLTYKNEELLLNGRLVTFAYDYKFYVNVQGQELVFEKDDEGNFRAIAYNGENKNVIDPELVGSIAALLKNLRTDKAF